MKRLKLIVILFLILVSTVNAKEKKFRFALVPKNANSDFFIQAYYGCMKAAKELKNIECIYASAGEANPRIQVSTLQKLLKNKVDGIALSVIDSDFLLQSGVLKEAQNLGIPIITFDSDLSVAVLQQYPKLRLSYIGTNNFQFGQALGKTLVKARPQGGEVCIQSGWKNSSNLNERIRGIRSILLNTKDKKVLQNRVTNKKWTESIRCPLYNNDNNKRALFQLTMMIERIDAFVAVGGWAQYSKNYQSQIRPFKKALLENKKTLIMGDTQPIQIELLKQKSSFYNVGQNPFKMGEESVHTLYKIKTNKKNNFFKKQPCCE